MNNERIFRMKQKWNEINYIKFWTFNSKSVLDFKEICWEIYRNHNLSYTNSIVLILEEN